MVVGYVIILLPLETLVGFLNTPYEVQESEGFQVVTIGLISGQLNAQIALFLSTLDDTATGEH